MFQFLRSAVQYIAPIFVICTMLNVRLIFHRSDRPVRSSPPGYAGLEPLGL